MTNASNIGIKEILTIPEMVSLPHLGILHYLLSKTANKHVAHCLDLDLVTTADSCDEAATKLDRLVKAHIELALSTGRLANLATRAPQTFWNEFAEGKRIELEPKTLHIEIPDSIQIIPLAQSELPILAHLAHAA